MITIGIEIPTTVVFWFVAFVLFSLEVAIRLEISLRIYRRVAPEEANLDPHASRPALLVAIIGNMLRKGLPTLIPVLLIPYLFGGIGRQIVLLGTEIGIIWQLIRFSTTLIEFGQLLRTGTTKRLISWQQFERSSLAQEPRDQEEGR